MIRVGLQDTWVLIILLQLLAPEVMFRMPHSYAVDYYAMGVITYEFFLGQVISLLITNSRGHIQAKRAKILGSKFFRKRCK